MYEIEAKKKKKKEIEDQLFHQNISNMCLESPKHDNYKLMLCIFCY